MERRGGGEGVVLKGQMSLCVYVNILVGCFPFNHNFWFEFAATSGSEWNSVFPGNFCAIWPFFQIFRSLV